MVKKFKKVAVGGTFDALHKGHERLLSAAFLRGDACIIGLTSDRLARELYKAHRVDPYRSRRDALIVLLRREGLASRARIIPIDSPEGPAAEIPDLEAILVSRETHPTALRINELRRRRGLKELKIITVKWVMAGDGEPISTTRIRSGKINREGRLLPYQ